MNSALDFPAGVRSATATFQINGAAEFGHTAIGILDHFIALDEVGILQAHFAAELEPEKWIYIEIIGHMADDKLNEALKLLEERENQSLSENFSVIVSRRLRFTPRSE